MIKLVYDKGECVGCPPEMGCMGRACQMCWVTKMFCDDCGNEVEELYQMDYNNNKYNRPYHLCEDCFNEYLAQQYPHITYDNCEDFGYDYTDK